MRLPSFSIRIVELFLKCQIYKFHLLFLFKIKVPQLKRVIKNQLHLCAIIIL